MIYALSNIVKKDKLCIQNYYFNTDLVENPWDVYIFKYYLLLKGIATSPVYNQSLPFGERVKCV